MTAVDRRILAIDVGAGTQDILIYEAGIPIENNIKLVLPAQTVIVSRRIQQATAAGYAIFLTGNLMGGGPSTASIRAHCMANYPVYAMPQAAKTIDDNLERVRALGIIIVDEPPDCPAVTIEMTDIDLVALTQALSCFDITLPQRCAIAVQDHGESLTSSQRRFRFHSWEKFLAAGGRLIDLAYTIVPPYMTRMHAVQNTVPGAIMMDTAGAAIWGALEDETVAAQRERGLVIINLGNAHTLGALVQGERIWGLFEHHTALIDRAILADHIQQLRRATLTNNAVYDAGGHGCCIDPEYRFEWNFNFTAVTGPNWRIATGLGYHRAIPHGDMMLAGSFGLLAASRQHLDNL
ncbi:DUF1786 domain-containing protein [Candidatus Acetothermia bacterium]|nr:DUF1786 domain-containing protein [Candidatus Acetothermia bacterium]MCI2427470.1 DUF1786 domain-containing protein [Candidatus Acetothermia bacterium]